MFKASEASAPVASNNPNEVENNIIKNYPCPYECLRAYKSKSSLNNHIRNKHSNVISGEYQCSYCQEVFGNERGLKSHQSRHCKKGPKNKKN